MQAEGNLLGEMQAIDPYFQVADGGGKAIY